MEKSYKRKFSMKKIYIAGKVSGEHQIDCTEKFANAKKRIEAKGFKAINPIEEVGDWNITWDVAMKICIAKLLEADAVILLGDWPFSKGARVEKQLANNLNIPIFSFSKQGLESMVNKLK